MVGDQIVIIKCYIVFYSQSVTEDASQEYVVVQKPCGFIYQFQLLSTWGDQYYCGLNGLEFYDNVGNLIELTDNSTCNFLFFCKLRDFYIFFFIKFFSLRCKTAEYFLVDINNNFKYSAILEDNIHSKSISDVNAIV